MADAYPQRIVCMTEEPTEVLYALAAIGTAANCTKSTVVFGLRPIHAQDEACCHCLKSSAGMGVLMK
jgi:hypothetical protein